MGVRPPAVSENSTEQPLTIVDLVNEHYRVLYAYAYRLTGSTSDAEDLTQQTYLIAQQKMGQLRDVGKVRSWLFRVLRNRFLRTVQKKRPAPASELNLEIGEISADTRLEDLDSELLQTAIDALPHDFKLVVLMFYFDELSYKEIASELEVPIGTVMSRLARAKSLLRNKLQRSNAEG